MSECLLLTEYDDSSFHTSRLPANADGANNIADLCNSRVSALQLNSEQEFFDASSQYSKIRMTDNDGSDFFLTLIVDGDKKSTDIQKVFNDFTISGIKMKDFIVSLNGYRDN